MSINKLFTRLRSRCLIAVITLCVIFFFLGFLVSYLYHFSSVFNSGQIKVVQNIAYYEKVCLNLSSNEVLDYFQKLFPQKLNYTQLLEWESTKLNYTTDREPHDNPIEILNYGKGACGEFAILYITICLVNDILARLVTPPYVISKVIDHVWVEVNPSKDNETWIHVDPTDSCVEIQKGKSISELTTINNPLMYKDKGYEMVLAFQLTQNNQVLIVDRTSVYNPKSYFYIANVI